MFHEKNGPNLPDFEKKSFSYAWYGVASEISTILLSCHLSISQISSDFHSKSYLFSLWKNVLHCTCCHGMPLAFNSPHVVQQMKTQETILHYSNWNLWIWNHTLSMLFWETLYLWIIKILFGELLNLSNEFFNTHIWEIQTWVIQTPFCTKLEWVKGCYVVHSWYDEVYSRFSHLDFWRLWNKMTGVSIFFHLQPKIRRWWFSCLLSWICGL